MDRNTKFALGKILGEIYKIQRHLNIPVPLHDYEVYGLLKGMEDVVDMRIQNIEYISQDKIDRVVSVLNKHFQNPGQTNLSGYFAIKDELEEGGFEIAQGEAVSIMQYIKAQHSFEDIIDGLHLNLEPIEEEI